MWQHFILSLVFSILFAQEIKLYEFSHNDCYTECKRGVLTSLDSCYFTSLVIFNGSLPKTTLVSFEVIELTSHHKFSLDIPTECKGFIKNADHYCSQMGNNIYNITIMIKGLSTFNDTKLRGFIKYSNGSKIYSEDQKIPTILSEIHAKGILTINGRNMTNESNCITSIHNNELDLEFQCVSHAESCVIDLLVNNDQVVMKQNGKHASYRNTYKHEYDLLVVVKYSACKIDGAMHAIQCEVKRDIHLKEIHGETSGTSFKLLVDYAVSFVAFFFVMGAVLLMIYGIKRKGKKNSSKVPESEIEETQVENEVFLRRKTGSSLGSSKLKNFHDEMDELKSEIESRIQNGKYNSKFDGLIKGYVGFRILLNAIKTRNADVAKYLIVDASSFINDLERYQQVCQLVDESGDPDIIGHLNATQLCYTSTIVNWTKQKTNDVPIPV